MVKLRIYKSGDKYWFLNDQYHRANGPSIVYNDGGREWYWQGKRHRANGTAIDWSNTECWYWHGQPVTEFELMMLAGQEITNG